MMGLGCGTLILHFALTSFTPQIDVVYPRPAENDTIARIQQVDYNFIFGSVKPPASTLTINGYPVNVHSNGAFLAYLPVNWETGLYELMAVHGEDTTRVGLPISTWIKPEELPESIVSIPAKLTLKNGVARTDPRGAYYLFPDTGTTVLATGWEKGYWEISLQQDRSVWIDDYYVINAIPAPVEGLGRLPVVWSVKLVPSDKWVDVSIPIWRKVLYRIWEDSPPDQLTIEFYGLISHLDLVSYPLGSEFVREVTWDVPSDGVLRLTIKLAGKCWGYYPHWERGKFVLGIRKPPDLSKGIRNLRIALDPGHGGDKDGAIGPTRLKEKDINLEVALELEKVLRRKCSEVIITRLSDVDIGLRDRVKLARELDADLMISIHHNALQDGTDPFGNYGTGTRYYHPLSRDYALAVQCEVVKELELPNEGIYYQNLALTRPTSMPAVLLEAAYMMLPEQEFMMYEEDYPKRLAKAIYKGIKRFATERRKSRDR